MGIQLFHGAVIYYIRQNFCGSIKAFQFVGKYYSSFIVLNFCTKVFKGKTFAVGSVIVKTTNAFPLESFAIYDIAVAIPVNVSLCLLYV